MTSTGRIVLIVAIGAVLLIVVLNSGQTVKASTTTSGVGGSGGYLSGLLALGAGIGSGLGGNTSSGVKPATGQQYYNPSDGSYSSTPKGSDSYLVTR